MECQRAGFREQASKRGKDKEKIDRERERETEREREGEREREQNGNEEKIGQTMWRGIQRRKLS